MSIGVSLGALSSRPGVLAVSVERQGCLRSWWSLWSWGAIGRTELGLDVSRAIIMAGNGTSKGVGTEGEEDAAKFAQLLAEGGSGLDRKLVFQHSHRQLFDFLTQSLYCE